MAQINLLTSARPHQAGTSREGQPWMADAACGPGDDAAFYPTQGATDSGDPYADARAICAGCPVRAECLEFALTAEKGQVSSSRFGVYGGMSPRERFREYRRRSAPATIPDPPPRRVTRSNPDRDRGLAMLAGGATPREVAARLDVVIDTVYRWRRTRPTKENSWHATTHR